MCASYVQANTNGRLHSADEPSISPLNRGFLYGDAIYEVWRTYNGVLFAWEEHWERLLKSADSLYFSLPFTSGQILSEIRKTIHAFRDRVAPKGEIYVRLQITRGGGVIGLDTLLADEPTFVILVQENKLFTPEKFRAGRYLSIARDLRRNSPDALNPAWKTGNYLNNILCLREARSRGADEVVIRNARGEITEAAVSNIGFVRDGAVVTPPLDSGILIGVTRRLLIEKVAPSAGVEVQQSRITPEDLPRMQECFLLSTTKDLTPVGRIDDYRFSIDGNTTTLRLKDAFARYVDSYTQSHPELRMF